MPPVPPLPGPVYANESEVSLGSSALLLATGPGDLGSDEIYRVRVLNVAGAAVSLGTSSVTVGGGIDQVVQGEDSVYTLAASETLYGIAASGGANVRLYVSRRSVGSRAATPTSGGSGGAPSGAAGGDLGGTYPNPTVPGLAAKYTKPGGGIPISDLAFDPATQAELDAVQAATVTSLAGKAQALVATSVKTAAYTAAPGDLIPVDATSSSVTITLPTTPADKTRVAVKAILLTAPNVVTINCGGSDTFNRTGGVQTFNLSTLAQGTQLQYVAATGVWLVTSSDFGLTQLDLRYITQSTVDAKGDLLVGTADNTLARVGVGVDGYALVADAAQAVGLKWAALGSAASGLSPGTQVIDAAASPYNMVGDCNGTVGNGTDNRTAIRAALTAAKAKVTATGSAVAIVVPAGCYRIQAAAGGEDLLTWGSKISLIGAGRGHTRFFVESASGATDTSNFIKGLFGSTSFPGTDMHFRGFELDMTNVFAPASYTPTNGKGFYMQYCKRSSWSDLYVHGTKATGVGVDFLVDCHIQDNVIDACGNFTAAQGTGDSGIGIGTGQSADEYVIITGNIVTNCRNYGIFVEKQGSGAIYFNRGVVISNNSCRGNRLGIADTGSQGTLIIGNQVNDNTAGGITVGQGAIGSGVLDGRETIVANNMVCRNTGAGIGLSSAYYQGRITIRGNRVAYNTGSGISGGYSSSNTSPTNPGQAPVIVDNEVHNNGSYGLAFGPTTNSGDVRDLIIERNRVYNNGLAGLRLKLNITRLRVVGNVFWDDQTARTVTDGALNSTTTLTSATAAFSFYDIGKAVTGTGIPAGTTIVTYTSATSVVLSQAATATASSVSVTIGTAATQVTGISQVTGATITDVFIADNDARACATPWTVDWTVISGSLVVRGNPGLLAGSATWDPPSIADGATTTTNVTVSGAAIGDLPTVSFGTAVPANAQLTASVSAANTVAVTLTNRTGAALDLASGTLKATVSKAA